MTKTAVLCTLVLGAGVVFSTCASAFGAENESVTFARDVAPIFQDKCQSCHRAGAMAPMSLVTWEESRPWAKAIRERVLLRQMPPWHIDKTVGIQQFQNDISLSGDQIATIVRWVDAGAPLREPERHAASQTGAGRRWLAVSRAVWTARFHPQIRALDDAGQGSGRMVQAADSDSGDRAPMGARRGDAARDSGRTQNYVITRWPFCSRKSRASGTGPVTQGLLMEWAVEQELRHLPPQYGEAAGSRRAHLVGDALSRRRRGNPRSRRTGRLSLSERPGPQIPDVPDLLFRRPGTCSSGQLDIPPNSIAQTDGYQALKAPARLENFQPHMHLRGKAMLLEAILPDGTGERSATPATSTSTG